LCSLLRRTFKHAPHCEDDARQLSGADEQPLGASSVRPLHVYPLLVTGVGRSATKFMQESLTKLGGQISHDNTEVGRHGAVAWPLAVRETGHLDPAAHGCNGYELPSFLHDQARTVVGVHPKARFEKVFHQVREPLKCIVSRANRIGMMYSPIAYGNPSLFALLTADLRKESLDPPIASTLELLTPPPVDEVRAYGRSRDVEGWPKDKRLLVALFHFVYWNAFIDLYADEVFRIEDTTAAQVCAMAPSPLKESCSHEDQSESGGGNERGNAKAGGGVSEKTNSHDLIDELTDTSWLDLCTLSPVMASRAQKLAKRYGYAVSAKDLC